MASDPSVNPCPKKYIVDHRNCEVCDEYMRNRLPKREKTLRDAIEGLIDVYDERSRDTEGADRYPWGVAADDLRLALKT